MRTQRDAAISVAALVSDAMVWDGYLSKPDATLIFDALAEGLIQQDHPVNILLDIETMLIARIDEPGELYNNADKIFGEYLNGETDE